MNDEISLGELFIAILKFIKRNIIAFSIALVVGLVLGYFKESRKMPLHKSEAVYCSDLLEARRLKEIVSDFETATIDQNFAFLAARLSIPEDSARMISSIKIELIESDIHYRTDVSLAQSKLHHCIKIICMTENAELFKKVERGILSAYTNHEDTKAIVDLRKSTYLRDIEKINNDLDFLREQRKKTYEAIQKGNTNIDINQFDNETNFVMAYEKMEELEELYLRTKAAVLMKPFNKMAMAKHSKTKGIAITIFLCLSAVGIVALFREIKL